MSDLARRLRAQKRCSTDPDYLERMARAAETEAGIRPQADDSADGGRQLPLELPAPRIGIVRSR
jgi:hypothetical protein